MNRLPQQAMLAERELQKRIAEEEKQRKREAQEQEEKKKQAAYMKRQEFREIVTLAIAIAGFVLAVISLIWQGVEQGFLLALLRP